MGEWMMGGMGMEGCVCPVEGVGEMGQAVDRSLLGWLCDLRTDCRSTAGQTAAAAVLEGLVASDPGGAGAGWGGAVSRDDGMCWQRREGAGWGGSKGGGAIGRRGCLCRLQPWWAAPGTGRGGGGRRGQCRAPGFLRPGSQRLRRLRGDPLLLQH